MSNDKVLFEVDGRLVDGWGNDNGEIPREEAPSPAPSQREVLANATATNADSGTTKPSEAEIARHEEEKYSPQYASDTALEGMKGDDLKAELKLRKDAGRDIDVTGVSTVAGLRDLLKADNKTLES